MLIDNIKLNLIYSNDILVFIKWSMCENFNFKSKLLFQK